MQTDKPWKAIYSSVVAGLGSLLVAVNTEEGAPVEITTSEWVTIVLAIVTAFGGTYFIDNQWGNK